jgi:coenzyme F420-reducing hydrogenase beta subunit
LIKCYVGYSADADIRWKSASGGLITSILCDLLEQREISAVITLKDSKKTPLIQLFKW